MHSSCGRKAWTKQGKEEGGGGLAWTTRKIRQMRLRHSNQSMPGGYLTNFRRRHLIRSRLPLSFGCASSSYWQRVLVLAHRQDLNTSTRPDVVLTRVISVQVRVAVDPEAAAERKGDSAEVRTQRSRMPPTFSTYHNFTPLASGHILTAFRCQNSL